MRRNQIRRLRTMTSVTCGAQASALCTLLLLGASTAWAGNIQKCVNADGQVSYSDKPCLTTEESETVSIRRDPQSDLRWPTPTVMEPWKKECAAARQALREQTVPLSELEHLREKVRVCLQLEILDGQREAELAAKAEAEERRQEIARMSPECQARYGELITLQTTMEAPDEIKRYIRLSDKYQSDCKH